MKILHTVEFYYPSLGGAQEAVKQLSERMVQQGHDVTVATSYDPQRKSNVINGVKVRGFNLSGNEVVGIKGKIGEYHNFLRDGDYDIMMNYAAQQWATDAAFDVLDTLTYKKVLVPCGYSALHNSDFEHYFERMPNILKKYDASIYFSKKYQDYAFARNHKIKNTRLIPNGADEKEFLSTPSNISEVKKRYAPSGFLIVSIGNHTGAKGHAESMEVLKLLPFPADLVIVGGDGPCKKICSKTSTKFNNDGYTGKSIKVLSLGRSDTLNILKSADLFLFLSNTEASPIVLYEAGAAGVPFVSTDVGNAREIARWTKGGYVTKTFRDSKNPTLSRANINKTVELIIRITKNKNKLVKVGKRTKKISLKLFTWDKITNDYLNLYKELCE